MTGNDIVDHAAKWNSRYLADKRFSDAPARGLLTSNSHLLPESGLALEIAGGMGVTADFLQRSGLDVLELDISYIALKTGHEANPKVMHVTADARFLPICNTKIDVICNFYFLERSLFKKIMDLLVPGGILFFETMTVDMLSIKPEIPPIHLLKPFELRNAFISFDVLHYFEGWVTSDHGKQKCIAQLIARKPYTSV